MSPTLAPTLPELRDELDRLNAERARIENGDCDGDEYDRALKACWHVLDQIAAIAAVSIADLRVKAYAFNWSAELMDDEPYENPSDGETLIMRQLVAGLLEEEIA